MYVGLTMTSFDIDIISGKIWPYCKCKTELIDSAEIYDGVSYGQMYICRNCNAYVGCHKDSSKSLGRLANEELRRYKHCAHLVFDMIWENHFMSRYNGSQKSFRSIENIPILVCLTLICACR